MDSMTDWDCRATIQLAAEVTTEFSPHQEETPRWHLPVFHSSHRGVHPWVFLKPTSALLLVTRTLLSVDLPWALPPT